MPFFHDFFHFISAHNLYSNSILDSVNFITVVDSRFKNFIFRVFQGKITSFL